MSQAEAANSATIDAYKAPSTQKLAESTATAQSEAEQVAAYEAEQQAKEKQKKAHEKYEADKKLALDQGYTEEQAEQYANQEALETQDGATTDKNNVAPAAGPNNVPPTQVGNAPASATKVQLSSKTGNQPVMISDSNEDAIE